MVSERHTRDEPDRRSRATTSHEAIRTWADVRGARPAAVAGTGFDGHLGVLDFELPGRAPEEPLREVGWDEWFDTFDRRGLTFLHQEADLDGAPSRFFRLGHPQRADT